MKKLTAISLISLGALLMAFGIFIIIDNTITITKFNGIPNVALKQTLQQRFQHSRNVAVILSFISAAVIFGGYKLKRTTAGAAANL